MVRKEISQSKQLWGWHEARTMNLQENGPRFRGKKLFFGLQMLRMMMRTTMNCWDTPGWKLEKLNQQRKDLKDLGERHMTDEVSFLHQTLKWIWE